MAVTAGHGNRQQAVLAAYLAPALCQEGNDHILYSQIVDADSRRGNVHDGVNGAYFMEMHFFQRPSVYLLSASATI